MATESLATTRRVEIINKKEFVSMVLNIDNENFLVPITALAKPTTRLIYPFCQAQIALLMSKKNGITVEYFEFSNVFSLDFTVELLEHTGINNQPINMLDNKQPPYNLIYSLRLVELELLKNYIKANLASNFIKSFKPAASTPILFV